MLLLILYYVICFCFLHTQAVRRERGSVNIKYAITYRFAVGYENRHPPRSHYSHRWTTHPDNDPLAQDHRPGEVVGSALVGPVVWAVLGAGRTRSGDVYGKYHADSPAFWGHVRAQEEL